MFLRSYLIYPLGPRALMRLWRGIWLTASACVSRSSQVAGLRAVAQGGLEVRTRQVRTPEPYALVVGGGGSTSGFSGSGSTSTSSRRRCGARWRQGGRAPATAAASGVLRHAPRALVRCAAAARACANVSRRLSRFRVIFPRNRPRARAAANDISGLARWLRRRDPWEGSWGRNACHFHSVRRPC